MDLHANMVVRFRNNANARTLTVRIVSDRVIRAMSSSNNEYATFYAVRVRPNEPNVSFSNPHSYTVRTSEITVVQ